MLVALVWAMVITVCAASSHGDNCKHVGKVKQDKEPTYCNGKDSDTCTTSKCDCMNCCKDDNACEMCCKALSLTESCKSGQVYDDAKDSTDAGSKDEFDEKCCKKKPVLPDNCENPDIVAKAYNAGKFCDVTKDTVPAAKFKTAVKADGSDYEDKCCAAKVKCGESFKCSKAGTKAVAATTECSTIPCEASECCEPDTKKCLGLLGEGCGTGFFADEAKYGEAATAKDYDDKCCTAMAKCEDFYASTNIGTTSASTQQHAVTLSLLLAVLAAMSKHL